MTRKTFIFICSLAVACATCSSSKSSDAPATPPFQADPAFVYVAKAKNVLVGLPVTPDEVAAVASDPGQLKVLIDGWMQLPQYQAKMMRFFELAFQQTQIASDDFADQFYPKRIAINNTTAPLLVQNAQESFARTMLQLIANGQPLTAAATTQQLMMTTALKELYAYLDVWEVDDASKVTDGFRKAHPSVTIVAETSQGPIPMAQTLDPSSSNYMHWYNPDAATEDANIAGCAQDPIVFPGSAATLHYLLYGSLDNRKTSGGVSCPQSGGSTTAPQLTNADFNDWALVTIRPPAQGEGITAFYDLPTLRAATELVLSVPRVGFFTTPAFFANWQTNISNQMRVTMNQALIVALGASVDGTDATTPPQTPGLDATHVTDLACYSCHKTLDPLRSIFAATYSWNYHNQLDDTYAAQKGLFAFQGVTQEVNSMSDLGAALANHPLFASAWTQKLCYYVNSAPCAPDDPEFQRLASLFAASGYAWSTLVRELVSSPITTNTAATRTAAVNGEVVAVARRDHLCAAINSRLGFTDVCGLSAQTKKVGRAVIPEIASGLPSDGYGRGSTAPVLPNRATLFYRAGVENIGDALAAQVIDVPAAKRVAGAMQWSSKQPDAAIADFVAIVMDLTPADPRSARASELLAAHFAAATQQGATPTAALQSTFVTACTAPSAISIGL